MVPPNNLGPNLACKSVNETSYRGTIGSLVYLTATRLDIQFSTVLCARYQSNPKESHLIDVKRILMYLKGTPTLGLYYPKCSGFDLKGYSDSDYTGCNMDRKITLGSDFTQDKKFGFLPPILSNSNFTKDPSKVIDIELKAHMITINNRRDSVSPPPLAPKLKKGKDTTSTTPNEGTAKTTPHPKGSLGDKDSGGNIPPADMEPIHTPVANPSGTGAKYQVDETQFTRLSDEEEVLATGDDMDEDPQDDAEVRTPSPGPTQPDPSHYEEAAVSYADLKASIDQYYDENIAHRDQTNKLVEASMSSLDRINGFDFSALLSTVKSLQDHAFKKEEASTAWMKSSSNMAWNLGSRMSRVELSQTTL
ncbi:hypothetical protein Tco_0822007 [Tanacetum coccineum]|uniref:Retrovirus-related Pol polyprotein from transposon TNT 1-94 n=1 Tax=Tanacetum coccineum TaxID=301880 RepID=A0ABQ5AI30_9ASTR